MIDSSVHAGCGAATESSNTSNSDYIVHAIVNIVKDSEWSSAVTLNNKKNVFD